MGHEFEVRKEIELAATPEQVWAAIATGPGVDSWLMGRTEIEPRLGGRSRQTLMGFTSESTVTAWEPGRRYAHEGDKDADGTFMAFEMLLEGREGGSTVLRFVHSGVLGGDWEAEYDALQEGDGMYLRKLAAYLEHFPGKVATHSVFAPGPQVADRERAWAAFKDTAGLSGTIAEGDPAQVSVEGLPPADGVVEFISPSFLGVRTKDAIHTFIYGYENTVVVEQHTFAPEADGPRIEQAWEGWLARTFA